MLFRYLFLFLILLATKSFALIEVDITRGNLNPLPVAVSPLSIDEESRKNFKKILKKENIGSEISEVVENNNNGILVNSMDFSSMAEAIITLINDPEKLESMANYSINKIKPRLGIVPCAQAHKKSFELAMKN